MGEVRDQATKSTWEGDSRGTRRRKWLAGFDELCSRAANSRGLIKIALDPTASMDLRTVAIWLLGKLQAKTAISPLMRLLKDSDDTISFEAAGALCEMSDRRMVPKLIKILLRAPLWRSREGTAWVLHKVTGPDAASALAKAALHDPEPAVRTAAVHGLITYPKKRTFATIAQALEDPSPRVRRMAVFAVDCLASRRGIEVTLPALKRIVGSTDDGNLRDEARMTIKALPRELKR